MTSSPTAKLYEDLARLVPEIGALDDPDLQGYLASLPGHLQDRAAELIGSFVQECLSNEDYVTVQQVLGAAIPGLTSAAPQNVASLLCGQAEAHLGTGDYTEGLRAAIHAREVADATTEDETSVRARVLASWGSRCLTDYLGAEQSLREAMAIVQRNGGLRSASHSVDLGVANLHMSRGEYEAALSCYEQLLAASDALDTPLYIKCAINRASALSMLHRYEDSESAFGAAAGLCHRHGRPMDAALAEHNRAIVRIEMGRFEAGLESCLLARSLLEALHADAFIGHLGITQSRSLVGLGRLDEATFLLRETREVLVARGMDLEVAKVDLNLAEIEVLQGSWMSALAMLDTAASEYRVLGMRYGPVLCQFWRGRAMLVGERWDEAAVLLTQTSEAFAELGQGLHAMEAQILAAGAWQESGQVEEALTAARRSIGLLAEVLTTAGDVDWTEIGVRSRVPDPYGMTATLLFGPGVRQLLPSDESANILLDEIAHVCEQGRSARLRADMSRMASMRPSDEEVGSASGAEREPMKAVAFRGACPSLNPSDTLRDVLESVSTIGSGGSGGLEFHVPSCSEISKTLSDDEGILAFYAYRDDLIAIALDNGGTCGAWLMKNARTQTRILADRLAALVQNWEDGYYSSAAEQQWTNVLQEAGELLLGPLIQLNWLGGKNRKHRICLVPSAELYAFPASALGTSVEDYVPLVELVEVEVSPQMARRLYWGGRSPEGMKLRGIIDPDGTLPGARLEGDSIRAAIPGADLIVGHNRVKPTFDWVCGGTHAHLACHGVFCPDEPMESGVLLGPRRNPGALIKVRDLLAVDAKLEVLFANACQTGMAAVLAGDALYGLVRAFLGLARTTVCTLWSIADQEAAFTAEVFYRSLSLGADSTTALATAQRELRLRSARSGIPYWAAHQLWR